MTQIRKPGSREELVERNSVWRSRRTETGLDVSDPAPRHPKLPWTPTRGQKQRDLAPLSWLLSRQERRCRVRQSRASRRRMTTHRERRPTRSLVGSRSMLRARWARPARPTLPERMPPATMSRTSRPEQRAPPEALANTGAPRAPVELLARPAPRLSAALLERARTPVSTGKAAQRQVVSNPALPQMAIPMRRGPLRGQEVQQRRAELRELLALQKTADSLKRAQRMRMSALPIPLLSTHPVPSALHVARAQSGVFRSVQPRGGSFDLDGVRRPAPRATKASALGLMTGRSRFPLD